MLDLAVLQERNRQAAAHYLETTPPRTRLLRRLEALELTTALENQLILASFDALELPAAQEDFANKFFDELREFNCQRPPAAA